MTGNSSVPNPPPSAPSPNGPNGGENGWENKRENERKYQAIVGSLLHISRNTRPDISVVTNILGRKASSPSARNFIAALRVLQYLLYTKSVKFSIKGSVEARGVEKAQIEVYADASYGGEGARSQTGVITFLEKTPVLWYTRRQDTVSLSITEAEYIAVSEGAKDAAWLRQWLSEFEIKVIPVICTDNEAADRLTDTQSYHRRTRHIDHKYHYIRQEIRKEDIIMKKIGGKENLANPLTKIVSLELLRQWTKNIGMKVVNDSELGSV